MLRKLHDRAEQLKGGFFGWLAVVNYLEPGQVSGQQFGIDRLYGERQYRLTEAVGILALANAGLRSQRGPRYDRYRGVTSAQLPENAVPPDLPACQVMVKPDVVSRLLQPLRYGFGSELVRPRIGKKDLH
ncbi:MAG: hypothetical protein M3Z75_09520 [Actinomycetota bacterium]|nr:hypothetical protein [Actinomycetota bacterium]